jgi:hypothetical protein
VHNPGVVLQDSDGVTAMLTGLEFYQSARSGIIAGDPG